MILWILTIFIAITSAAVVIQAGILVAMFLPLRKTSSKMKACRRSGSFVRLHVD